MSMAHTSHKPVHRHAMLIAKVVKYKHSSASNVLPHIISSSHRVPVSLVPTIQ